MLCIDLFNYISLFLKVRATKLCYCFEGYARAADSFSETGQNYLLLCLDWYIIFSVISGISTLHFGLECKNTWLLHLIQKNTPTFAPASTFALAFASPLSYGPVLWSGSKTSTLASSLVSVTSVQSKTKEKQEENTVKKLKRGQMRRRKSQQN